MKNRFGLWLLAGAGGLSITGCCCSSDPAQPVATLPPPQPAVVVYPQNADPAYANPRNEVIMVDPPPEPRVQVVAIEATEARVWVGGHWIRTDNRWIWIPSHDEIWQRPGGEEATAIGGVVD